MAELLQGRIDKGCPSQDPTDRKKGGDGWLTASRRKRETPDMAKTHDAYGVPVYPPSQKDVQDANHQAFFLYRDELEKSWTDGTLWA